MKDKRKKLKCYIYLRVSTMMQVDGYSLDAQRNRLLAAAEYHDLTIVREFSDAGISGKNITGRPQFSEMMRLIESGNPDGVSYVLVFKLSRFARNAADVLCCLQVMQSAGVELIAAEEGINSSGPAGKLVISVLAAVAEIERENIRSQSIAGQEQKAKEGGWNGGPAPFGYRLVRDEDGKHGRLVIDEEEAEIVRLLFDKYAHTHMGYNGVAKWLNAHGYSRDVRSGKYSAFTDFAVKTILDNPIYTGKVVYGRFALEKVPGTRDQSRSVKHDKYNTYEGQHEIEIAYLIQFEPQIRFKICENKALDAVKTPRALFFCFFALSGERPLPPVREPSSLADLNPLLVLNTPVKAKSKSIARERHVISPEGLNVLVAFYGVKWLQEERQEDLFR